MYVTRGNFSTLTGVDLSRYHLVDVYEERYPTTGQGHKIELEIDHFQSSLSFSARYEFNRRFSNSETLKIL